MAATLQGLFQREFASYARKRRLPPYLHNAARAIQRCRTAALGGHVRACRAGHVAGIWYNSCRHRACPQCAKLQIDRWLEGWRQRLLPCDHYHVVFTMPHELLDLWKCNRRTLSDLLFRTSRDTLFELLGDPRYLGAEPGVIAALHTWGRTLSLHPHVHCLVTGGGTGPEGQWKASRSGYLLPVRVVQALFRGKLLARLRKATARGELNLPIGLSEIALSNLYRRLYAKRWNVRLMERYPHGRGVLLYLARYVRGGPIRNRRLLEAGARAVTFVYHDHRDGRSKTLSLVPDEFLHRLLWHVPPPRTHVIRLYGIYGRKRSAECEACRRSMPHPGPPAPGSSRTMGATPVRLCRVCGRPLDRFSPLPSRRHYRPRRPTSALKDP